MSNRKRSNSDLTLLIMSIVDRRRDEPIIGPAWVATEVLQTLDPRHQSPDMVYAGCFEHAKQIARQVLRTSFEGVPIISEEEDPQLILPQIFTELQYRYPAAPRSRPNAEPVYVLLELMTKDDVDFNVSRFRNASESLAKHADALQSWWDGRAPA